MDGTRYSVTVEADSVYHAAVLFFAHCGAPPPGTIPPHIRLDAVLEVRPVYRVALKDAMKWANEEANRKYES